MCALTSEAVCPTTGYETCISVLAKKDKSCVVLFVFQLIVLGGFVLILTAQIQITD